MFFTSSTKPLNQFYKLLTNGAKIGEERKHKVIRFVVFHFAKERRKSLMRLIARDPDQNAATIEEVLVMWMRMKWEVVTLRGRLRKRVLNTDFF